LSLFRLSYIFTASSVFDTLHSEPAIAIYAFSFSLWQYRPFPIENSFRVIHEEYYSLQYTAHRMKFISIVIYR
jgi:hypothetical protein